MATPDWALVQRKKNQEIKKIQNKYYLYEVSSVYDKEKKKTKKISGKCLGRLKEPIITENLIEKLVENSTENSSTIQTPTVSRALSVKEYGASDFIISSLSKEIELLKIHIPSDWQQILVCCVFRLLYQSAFKQMNWHYESSYLSELYANLRLDGKNLSAMVQSIGKNREALVAVMKGLQEGEELILIDSTHITTQSKQNLSAQLGYNSQRQFDPQINLLYLFSQDQQMPIFYRCVQGSVREVRSLQLTLKESGLKSSVLVSDKGFYSENNVKTLEENEWSYVLPLRRSSKSIDYEPAQTGDRKKFDGYFIWEERIIWYKTTIIENNKRVILFLDEALKTQENKDYLSRAYQKIKGYDIDTFHQKQAAFGTISVLTNTTSLVEIQQETTIQPTAELKITTETTIQPTTELKITAEPTKTTTELKTTESKNKKAKSKKSVVEDKPKTEKTYKEVPMSPQKVYTYLKSRNDIEQLNDSYKNVLEADKTYMQNEAGMEAWHFINFLAIRVYYRLFALLVELDLTKKYSPADVLLLLQNHKKIKIDGKWHDNEIPKKAKIIIDKIFKKQPVT